MNILLISDNEVFKNDLAEQIVALTENASFDENALPDVVILDDKPETAAALAEKYPHIPLICLLSKNEGVDVHLPEVKTIQKPFALTDFMHVLQSAQNLMNACLEGHLKFNVYELDLSFKVLTNTLNAEKIKLTEREADILGFLYKKKNIPTQKNELLQYVWKYHPDATTHTVETHIYRLRQKVEKNKDFPQLIATKNGGYVLLGSF